MSTADYGRIGDDRRPPRICACCPFDFLPAAMLACIMCLTFGSYWVFDTPGAIQSQLTEWFPKDDKGNSTYTNSMNLALYAVYSWPNTVLAFFGGIIIDRYTGIRGGCILFCALILTGQVLFCIGIQWKVYYVCLAGRFVFGLGGESLTVGQNAYTTRWFSGPTLALAFGAVLAFARIGSSVNFIVTPILAEEGVPIAVWFGAGTCALSMTATLIAAGLDKFGSSRFDAKVDHTKPAPPPEEPASFSQVRKFPSSAWLLMLLCLFFYICVLTFYTVASKIFANTGNKYDDKTASLFLAIPNLVSIVMSPTFGRVIDKVGRALTLLLVASCMMVVAHSALLILATEVYLYSPVYVMLWLGVAYSLGAACLWPLLSVVVPKRLLGTAYGTMTAVQNAGLALFPTAIGIIQDNPDIKGTTLQYTIPIFIFIGCAGIAIILTLVLIGVDAAQNKGAMNASAARRKEIAADKERMEALLSSSTDSLASPVGPDGHPVDYDHAIQQP